MCKHDSVYESMQKNTSHALGFRTGKNGYCLFLSIPH